MAFKPTNFEHTSGHTPGRRTFHYVDTGHTLAEIAAADFFLPLIGFLAVNDFMFITGSNGGGLARVNANTGTSIDITDAVAVNTDSG